MKQLELKDLKHYLGTGLKFGKEGQVYNEFEMAGIINEFVVSTNSIHRQIGKYKPLMLPLSALTEPLPDGSIPMHTLFPRIDFDKDREDGFEWHIIKNNWGLKLNGKNHNASGQYLSLKSFEYLYANHFWLGGQSLFETGEIIDKRTLKQTP